MRRIRRRQVGRRDCAGKRRVYLYCRKNENTKMENGLGRAGSAHFPSGWLAHASFFFLFLILIFFYTNQFSHSSVRSLIRLLRSNFLPRPPRGARGHSLPRLAAACLRVSERGAGGRGEGWGRHVFSLCGRSRLHASLVHGSVCTVRLRRCRLSQRAAGIVQINHRLLAGQPHTPHMRREG